MSIPVRHGSQLVPSRMVDVARPIVSAFCSTPYYVDIAPRKNRTAECQNTAEFQKLENLWHAQRIFKFMLVTKSISDLVIL